jgi:SWI/SNF-related matrix-associated actin-dependent regulator 1 of chromatin subfamily A
MTSIPEINKKNYQKILRELDIAQFPSFNTDIYLKNVRDKLVKKEKLTFSEEQISFHRFKMYLDDCRKTMNRYYVSKMDFSRFAHRPPLDFQEEGIKFLLSNERCILSDDMGLGKSLQAVIASMCLPENYKILLVTMKSLKYNFKKEIDFYNDSYKVIEKTWESGYKFTLVHYDSLKKWKKEIKEEKFDCVISDESHLLINTKSARTKNFAGIVKEKSIKKVWLLTGTPITNRPYNYFNLLKLIKHPLTKNWKTFVERYCNGHKDYFGKWVVDGSSNEQELYEKTKDSVLRRLKKDHVKDLPNKDRQPIFLNMDNWKGYNQVIKDYEQKKTEELIESFGSMSDLIDEGIEVNSMTKLILWRQFCALEKIRDGSLIELINNQIDQGNKIVVFTNFTSVVDAVYDHFGSGVARMIDGRVGDPQKRLDIVDEFNNTPSLKVLVLNLQVGGTGLNIQSANVAIINDMYWVPGTMLQAEDRLWRIGQEREVLILYPVYEKTVETIMYDVINKKMKTISSIVEGKKESYFESPELVKENDRKSILSDIFAQMS